MLIDQIQTDLKNAQLARDEVKVSTLRLLLSEIHNAEIQKAGNLSDEDALAVCQREAKKRKEAAAAFRVGNREEAASKEEAELKILEGYLPAQMSNEELTKVVLEVITEMGVSGIADMGKVIGVVMGRVKGKAEGAQVSAIVKDKLANA